MPSVLIVDDLTSIHEMLEAVIQPTGFTTAFATDGTSALAKFREEPFDLVLADIVMTPMDGITLLRELKSIDPKVTMIMMTGHASKETARDALRLGAFDYLMKPLKVDELMSAIRRGVEASRLARQDSPADSGSRASVLEKRFPGNHPRVQRARAMVLKVMDGNSPVLIQGEKGSGKAELACLIQSLGPRAEKPFVRQDCASLPSPTIVAGLAGKDPATTPWLQQAGDGTLLLENIDSLPTDAQLGLIKILKLGDCPCRILTTASRDLETLIEAGSFDGELSYRLASLPIFLPPLRQRLSDLPVLIQSILEEWSENRKRPTPAVSEDARQQLGTYAWPGNLQELREILEHMAEHCQGHDLDASQVPERLQDLSHWPSLADHLAEEEKVYIQTILQACGQDREQAARILKCPPERLA